MGSKSHGTIGSFMQDLQDLKASLEQFEALALSARDRMPDLAHVDWESDFLRNPRDAGRHSSGDRA